MKFLIVDDEYVSRVKLAMMFSHFGGVETAENGNEALKKIKQSHDTNVPYDLCVLDLEMPGITGEQVIQKIREFEKQSNAETQEMKILIISSKDFNTVFSAHQKGSQGYLVKPVNKETAQMALSDLGLLKDPNNKTM